MFSYRFAFIVLVVLLYETSDQLVTPQTSLPISGGKKEMIWNPSQLTWENFHTEFCLRSCTGIPGWPRISRDFICLSPHCFPCDCDDTCHIYGTCCLSAEKRPSPLAHKDTDSGKSLSDDDLVGRFSCKMSPTPKKGDETKYFMVTKCPSTWNDNNIRRLCEEPEENSLDAITPYTVKSSGLTFLNIHCGHCNGFSSVFDQIEKQYILPWQLEIICKNFQSFYQVTDWYEFFVSTRAEKKICLVEFQRPKGSKEPKVCPMWNQYESTVNNCSMNDPHVTPLCNDLKAMPALEVTGYKNIFCALCNGVTPLQIGCIPPDEVIEGIVPEEDNDFISAMPPILLLFGASGSAKDHIPKILYSCSTDGQWRNEEGVCISPVCTRGKILNPNSQCESAIPQIQGLGYNLTLIFTTTNGPSVRTSVDTFMALDSWVRTALDEIVAEMDVTLTFDIYHPILNTTPDDDVIGTLQRIQISGHILADPNMQRDIFEQSMANFSQGSLKLNSTDNPFNISLRRTHLGFYITDIPDGPNFYKIRDFSECVPGRGLNSILPIRVNRRDNTIYSFYHRSTCVNQDLWRVVHMFIDYTVTLTCPFISFNITREPAIENNTVVFTFELRGKEVNVTSCDGVSFSGGQIHVCLDFLNTLTESVIKQLYYQLFEDNPVTVAEYYIEIICFSVSILCLLFSVLTYSLFPPLRSLPGLNSMCLCISLLTAHMSLLITSLFGIRGYFPTVYCIIHAVILHYSWLASFMWMNICCIHMYRVFTATGTKFSDTHSDRKRLKRYSCYGFGFPAVVVIMTSGITLAVTGGRSSGYNDQICFLDIFTSILIIILGLLLPFAFTTLSNAVLFVLTVREIVHVSSMAEHAGTRKSHGVIAYVKLSTLTGVFCILAAIAVQFKSPVAALLASPFVALQGLFIFLSFLANRHVLTLYQAFFRQKVIGKGSSFDSPQTKRASTSTKLTFRSTKSTTTI